MAKTRAQNEIDINSLYGCPGAEYDSNTGRELLAEVLARYGLASFSDDFIAELAARHRMEDMDAARRSEAAHRRASLAR